MTARRCFGFGVCLIFAGALWAQSPAASQEPQLPAFEQKLRESRYELHVEKGRFTGSAAEVLEDAIAGAQFVLIGEDHITREIPQFTSVVCDVMAPKGLSAMVIESSPLGAQFVSAAFGKPDRLARMAALLHKYPLSVAFLNIQQENDLAAHCAEAAHNPDFHLWGLDQEFVGSAGWLLDQILETHPGPAAITEFNRLREEEKQGAASANENGDPSKLFLFAVPDAELVHAAAVLRREGSPAANEIFHKLIESHEIYLKFAQGHVPESNSQRARLLKRNLRQDQEAAAKNGQKQRLLVKFGDSHLYKGFNELRQRDLGNYIAEVADAQGGASLHIRILGAKGTHRRIVGYNRPTQLEPFVMTEDESYHWLKPAVENQIANAWTLYDLRKLRFQKLGSIDPDMERSIYGYDLLIIIPELTPADPIE